MIDKEGLHTYLDKVKAVKAAPVPTNIKQLKSFIGSVNYYGKFVPNLATLLEPLYQIEA